MTNDQALTARVIEHRTALWRRMNNAGCGFIPNGDSVHTCTGPGLELIEYSTGADPVAVYRQAERLDGFGVTMEPFYLLVGDSHGPWAVAYTDGYLPSIIDSLETA